jgi:hypothetical protein
MFIDKIMNILETFYSPVFLSFLVILLLVQIGIVIAHRKHNYAIFLAKGISWGQVRMMVLLQIGLSFLVAISLSVLVGEVMQGGLALKLYHVTTVKPYIDHILASNLDLLPLGPLDYLIVGSLILMVLYLTTEVLLNQMVAKRQMEPAYLFE